MLLAAIPWGQAPVSAVRLDAPGAQDPGRLRAIFAVRAGDVLSRQAVRHGVQALLASGEVEDVRVELAPETGGYALVVHAQVASRVSRLEFESLPARHRDRVARELAIGVGTPLHQGSFEQALARAVEVVRADGFPQATLEPELEFNVPQGTVSVRLVGHLGPPLLLCQLEAHGLSWDQGKLWKACGVSRGQRLTAGTREGMRRRLLAALRREGFWQAEVEGPVLQSQPCGTLARFDVAPGERFELQLAGDPLPKDVLAESLPFLSGEDGFADGSEEWLASRVRLALQRRGYLKAQVTVAQQETGSGRRLVVAVARGRKLPVVAVRFPGIADGDPLTVLLRQHVAVVPGRLRSLAGVPIDEDTLNADRESAKTALQWAGFPQAEVRGPVLVEEKGGLAVEFPVTLGPRMSVEKTELRGWPEAVSVPVLPIVEGGPWSRAAQEQAQAVLAESLANAGFPEARVGAMEICQEQRCQVTFDVAPGPPVTLERVVVAALGRTRPDVVEKVVGLKAGEPYSQQAFLEAERRLLALGIFDKVGIRDIPGQDTGLFRGVVVEPREAPSRSVTAGIGWDTEEKLRVSASWSELNLFGRARTLSLEGRFSSRQRRLQVNYREPAKLGLLGFPTWVAVYRTEESFPTYSLLRRGMWVELGDHLARPRRVLLRYDYQIIAPDAPLEVLSGLERTKQNLRLASLTPILEWDTRDDVFSPRKGFLASLQLQRAFPVFLADASFGKLTASYSLYQPVRASVLALGLRAGIIKPQQGSPQTPDNFRVPIAVRFFAGGRVSHRAFATDRLGVRGQTLVCPASNPNCPQGDEEPVGGAALLLGSVEWRIPVSGAFGATIFVDSGNTWASASQVRAADLRWGAGLGLRFDTPVGPLRLEYGWKLDRLPGESKGELFLSFGNPF